MRLIDANALKDALIECTPYAIDPIYRNTNSNIDMFTMIDMLDKQPTIEPKCGEWIGQIGATCSVCGAISSLAYVGVYNNFCPNCGACMIVGRQAAQGCSKLSGKEEVQMENNAKTVIAELQNSILTVAKDVIDAKDFDSVNVLQGKMHALSEALIAVNASK